MGSNLVILSANDSVMYYDKISPKVEFTEMENDSPKIQEGGTLRKRKAVEDSVRFA